MKLKINGTDYELPQLDDLTFDECITVEQISGRTLDNLELGGSHLSVASLKGLITVGIQRAEPKATEQEISEALGTIKFGEIAEQFQAEAGQSPPDEQNDSGSDESDAPTGTNGGDTGAPPPEPATLRAIGGPGSVTGADSDPLTWDDSGLGSSRAAGSS